MAVPSLLIVDGVEISAPSSFTWNVQDISDSDAGRTLDGVMHKNRIAQKRKLELIWNAVKFGTESAAIITAFTPEYINITYPDPQDGAVATRKFYTGDKKTSVKCWWEGNQLLTELSFNVIEV